MGLGSPQHSRHPCGWFCGGHCFGQNPGGQASLSVTPAPGQGPSVTQGTLAPRADVRQPQPLTPWPPRRQVCTVTLPPAGAPRAECAHTRDSRNWDQAALLRRSKVTPNTNRVPVSPHLRTGQAAHPGTLCNSDAGPHPRPTSRLAV